MTRKHYKIAADAFAQARRKASTSIDDEGSKIKALQTITELECNLMNIFIVENPRFSVVKFLAASK
jgi:hypothetical protein